MLALLLTSRIAFAHAATVALNNLEARLDTDGAVVDCHSGNVVWFNEVRMWCS